MGRFGWPKDKSLKKINNLLVILIVLINAYVIISPFWPKAKYEIQTKITKPVTEDVIKFDRSYDHLIIPSLQIDSKIIESSSESALNNGLWIRPNGSTPDKGSNTIIVGHRYNYAKSSVFYNLDKLSADKKVYVVYDGKIYTYRVIQNKIVPSNDYKIESPSRSPIITLYTCTPFWSFKDRLVYKAALEEIL